MKILSIHVGQFQMEGSENSIVVDKVPHGGTMKIELEVSVGQLSIIQLPSGRNVYSFPAHLNRSLANSIVSPKEFRMIEDGLIDELLMPPREIGRFTGLDLSDENNVD